MTRALVEVEPSTSVATYPDEPQLQASDAAKPLEEQPREPAAGYVELSS